MSFIKNRIVDGVSSLLSSVLKQKNVQDAAAVNFDGRLLNESDQLHQILDSYFQKKSTHIHLQRIMDGYLQRPESQWLTDQLIDNYLQRPESQWLTDKLIDNYLSRDVSQTLFAKVIEENKLFQKAFWKMTNVRPSDTDMHWAAIPNSIREQRMVQATIQAGEFVHKHIPQLEGKKNAYDTLGFALDAVSIDGSYLEFGVFSGSTISFIANHVDKTQIVHGFDSFEGLPEDWGAAKKGTFDTGGLLPEVPDNVALHKGWFDQTIPEFKKTNKQSVAFLHADADLYSSTNTILTQLSELIVSGTIIVFDEYFNYPYWRDHEYKSFMEFVEATNRKFEYIAYTDRGYSVAVKIL